MRLFFVITCHNVLNVWPKTTLLLPVWPRDAKRLDTPDTAWSGLNGGPPKRQVHILTLGTCECDFIWEKGLDRRH